jgi:hypothetical protein
MASVQDSDVAVSTTSARLISGGAPGASNRKRPIFVYLTDLSSWYALDPNSSGTADNNDLITDASGNRWRRMAVGGAGDQCVLFDDFLGDVLADEWAGAAGTDPQAVAPAISAGVGGMVRLTSGDVGGGDDAVDASVLTQGLNWKASQGGLMMQARVKLSAITDVAVFVGFTDDAGTAEFPIHSAASADTVTDNATDACGLMFDTAMATDMWGLIGTKNGTQTTFESAAIAPAQDTYQVIRVEVSAAGALSCYINGTQVGSTVEDAVTASVALTPVLAVMSRTTATRSLDADYIKVQQSR